MRKLIYIPVIAALAISTSALGAHVPTGAGPGGQVNVENPDGFNNKGRCQSALSHEINRQRRDPDERVASRQDQKSSDFQRDMLDRFECRADGDDGPWRVFLR